MIIAGIVGLSAALYLLWGPDAVENVQTEPENTISGTEENNFNGPSQQESIQPVAAPAEAGRWLYLEAVLDESERNTVDIVAVYDDKNVIVQDNFYVPTVSVLRIGGIIGSESEKFQLDPLEISGKEVGKIVSYATGDAGRLISGQLFIPYKGPESPTRTTLERGEGNSTSLAVVDGGTDFQISVIPDPFEYESCNDASVSLLVDGKEAVTLSEAEKAAVCEEVVYNEKQYMQYKEQFASVMPVSEDLSSFVFGWGNLQFTFDVSAPAETLQLISQ